MMLCIDLFVNSHRGFRHFLEVTLAWCRALHRHAHRFGLGEWNVRVSRLRIDARAAGIGSELGVHAEAFAVLAHRLYLAGLRHVRVEFERFGDLARAVLEGDWVHDDNAANRVLLGVFDCFIRHIIEVRNKLEHFGLDHFQRLVELLLLLDLVPLTGIRLRLQAELFRGKLRLIVHQNVWVVPHRIGNCLLRLLFLAALPHLDGWRNELLGLEVLCLALHLLAIGLDLLSCLVVLPHQCFEDLVRLGLARVGGVFGSQF